MRAANTGISAVVDPLGRITAALPLGTEGVLDARLPKAAPPTFYSRTGDLPTTGIAVALATILVLRSRRRRAKT